MLSILFLGDFEGNADISVAIKSSYTVSNSISLKKCKLISHHAASLCTGVGPKVDANAFDDLLGTHNFTSKPSSKPTTLKGLRTEQLAQEVDPDKLKVCRLTLYTVDAAVSPKDGQAGGRAGRRAGGDVAGIESGNNGIECS